MSTIIWWWCDIWSKPIHEMVLFGNHFIETDRNSSKLSWYLMSMMMMMMIILAHSRSWLKLTKPRLTKSRPTSTIWAPLLSLTNARLPLLCLTINWIYFNLIISTVIISTQRSIQSIHQSILFRSISQSLQLRTCLSACLLKIARLACIASLAMSSEHC